MALVMNNDFPPSVGMPGIWDVQPGMPGVSSDFRCPLMLDLHVARLN